MSKPSEKAMQLARQIGNWLDVKLTEPQGLWALAHKIDAHTAEALSEQATFYQKQLYTLTETVKEHKRVLDECERALQTLRDYWNGEPSTLEGTRATVNAALISIAKLRKD